MHNRGRKFPRLERECVSFWASSLAAYARQAKNMELEADALEDARDAGPGSAATGTDAWRLLHPKGGLKGR
jgi:hypothetical protein